MIAKQQIHIELVGGPADGKMLSVPNDIRSVETQVVGTVYRYDKSNPVTVCKQSKLIVFNFVGKAEQGVPT